MDSFCGLSKEMIEALAKLTPEQIRAIKDISPNRVVRANKFIAELYQCFIDHPFTYISKEEKNDAILARICKGNDTKQICVEYADINIIAALNDVTTMPENQRKNIYSSHDHYIYKSCYLSFTDENTWKEQNKELLRMFGEGKLFITHPTLKNVKLLDWKLVKLFDHIQEHKQDIWSYVLDT
jgi:hypothetical protein